MSDKIFRDKSRRRSAARSGQFVINLDREDREALDEASRIEKLPRTDILRRALRAYYRKLRQTDQQIAS
jgi:Ribbon-helix-helix protein, copG family